MCEPGISEDKGLRQEYKLQVSPVPAVPADLAAYLQHAHVQQLDGSVLSGLVLVDYDRLCQYRHCLHYSCPCPFEDKV